MKNILIILLLITSVISKGQDTTFNKLIKPYSGTLSILSILKNNSNYYCSIGQVDTPNISVQNFGVLKLDSSFSIIDSSLLNINKYATFNRGNGLDIDPQDSSLILAGTIKNNFQHFSGYIVKFDKNLDTLWTKQISHPDTAYADTAATPWVALRDVKVTPSGDYIIVGNYNYHCQGDRYRPFIIKMDSGGEIIWYQLLDIIKHPTFILNLTIEQSDSGFYLISRVSGITYLYHYDKNCNYKWASAFNYESISGHISSIRSKNNSIIIGSNYFIPPYTNGSFGHLHVSSIDKQTHVLNWTKKFYSISIFSAWLRQETIDIEITPSGNIAVGTVGVKYEDNQFTADHRANILMLNPQGQKLWSRYYTYSDNSMGAEDMQFNDMVVCPDGGLLFGGDRAHNSLFIDAWLVKTDSMGYCPHAYTVSIEGVELVITPNKLSIYPNPAVDNINFNLKQNYSKDLQLSIYSSSGALVKQQQLISFGDNYKINVQQLAVGIYFIRLQSNKKVVYNGKFIKN